MQQQRPSSPKRKKSHQKQTNRQQRLTSSAQTWMTMTKRRKKHQRRPQRKRRPRRRKARVKVRVREEFKYPQSGHGRKQRKYSRSLMCYPLTKWRCTHLFFLCGLVLIFFQLEWKNPDVEGLVDFLVKEKGFKYAPCFLCNCNVNI